MIGKLIINVLITLVGMAFLVRYFCYFDKKYEKYDKNDNSDKNEKGAGKISEKSKKPEMLEFSELKEYIKAKKKFFIISGVIISKNMYGITNHHSPLYFSNPSMLRIMLSKSY